MNDCIFCKIGRKELNSKIIFEKRNTIAILDVNPCTNGHILVIPKQHFQNIFDISEDVLTEVSILSQKIAILLKEKLDAKGVNILNASGKVAQQSVNHLHFHIVPRFEKDNLDLWFHGKGEFNQSIEDVFSKLKN